MRQDAPRNFRFPSAALSAAFPAVSTNGCYRDRKSTRLNSSHGYISYAVFCLKKKKHNARLHGQPHQELLLSLARLTPHDATHRGVRPEVRRVHRERPTRTHPFLNHTLLRPVN